MVTEKFSADVQHKRPPILAWMLAGLLFFAAAAKAYAGRHGDFWPIMLAQAAVEILLAAWLVSGIGQRWAFWLATVLFMLFAGVSLTKIVQGFASCGCFGTISTPPVYVFLIDLLIVSLLILGGTAARQSGHGLLLRSSGAGFVLAVGLGALFVARHLHATVAMQNPTVAPARREVSHAQAVQPEYDVMAVAVSKTQWLADAGTIPHGKTLTVLFKLSSPVDHDVQIRGVNASCGCTSIPNPPQTLTTTGTSDVRMIIQAPDKFANLDTQVLLTTDVVQLPPLSLRVIGKVR
jgi:hypothetical protein